MCQAHESGVGAERGANVSGVDHTRATGGNQGVASGMAFREGGDWSEHGIVFERADHDVVTGAEDAVNRQVQRIGAVVAKDNLVLDLGLDQFAEGVSALRDDGIGLLAR